MSDTTVALPAPPTNRAARVLARFPRHLEADAPGKLLGVVAGALGLPLDGQTTQAGEVRRARRLADAGEERDLLRLGGLHGLGVAALAVIRQRWAAAAEAGAIPEGPEAAHSAWLDVVRATIATLILSHCTGNGTVAGLLRSSGAYLAFEVDEIDHSADRWWHLATCRDRLAALPAETEPDLVALEENPFRRRDISPVARRHGQRFRVVRSGFEAAPVTVVVRGVEERTVRPMVVDIDRGEGLCAEVNVPVGEDLRFESDGRVTLAGAMVAGQAWRFTGAVFADAGAPRQGRDFVWAQPGPPEPEGGRAARFATSSPVADAFEPAPSLPHTEPLVAPLLLSPGESSWTAFVGVATFAGRGGPDAATVLTAPRTQAGVFDGTVFEPAADLPAFEIGFEWDEREPFVVRLWLPLRLADLDGADEAPVRERVRGLLDRHRAAGVHVRVEYADPRWVLGTGIVRDLETDEAHGVVVAGTTAWEDGAEQPPPTP